MIKTDEELALTRDQLARAERALAAIRRDVLPLSQARFRLMAENYVEQIRDLRAQVDAYLGIDLLTENQTSVIIGLEGSNVRLGETPVGVMTRTLDAFRRGLQALVETTQGRALQQRTGGRRKKWIEQLCDPPLMGMAPGSMEILLGEPDISNLFSEEDLELYRNNLKILFSGLAWAADRRAAKMEPAMRDEALRHSVLSVVRKLVPPRNGPVEAVTFRGRSVGYEETLRLPGSARIRLNRELARLSMNEEYQYTDAVGTIREVDLDARAFILRGRQDGLPDLTCEYDETSEADVKAFLDETIIVTGLMHTSRKTGKQTLEVETIDPDALEDQEAIAEDAPASKHLGS